MGCGIFVPGVFMLLSAMEQEGQGYAWGSATIVGLFVGFGVMAVLFGVWEWRMGEGAMIPPQVVGRRTVLFAVLFAFCHMGSLTVATYYLPLWFQAVEGVDVYQSGIRYSPTVVTQIVMTVMASSLGGYFGCPSMSGASTRVADECYSFETEILQPVVLPRTTVSHCF